MIFLDTGFFLALFNSEDELNPRSLAWSQVLEGEAFLVTEFVLWKCVNAFSKPRNRASAHALVQYANAECEMIQADHQLFEAGLKLHRERTDKEWSLTDCISFHVMRERDVRQALAHDIHFEQAGFNALLRGDP